MWRAQVLPAICGARCTGLLDGSDAAPPEFFPPRDPDKDKDKETEKVPNPEYKSWLEWDEQVLSYILNSLSKEIMMHVIWLEQTAEVWKAIESMFASQSISKITNLRIALANTKKQNLSAAAFVAKMQGFADELAAAGKPLSDDELVSFLLAGLGGQYNSLVDAIGVSKIKLTVEELLSQLQTVDERRSMLSSSVEDGFETSANSATWSRARGGGGGYRPRNSNDREDRRYDRDDRRYEERRDDRRQDDRPRYNFNRGGGRGGRAPAGGGRRGRGRRRTTPWVDVTCQICNREGLAAKDCWHRFQDDGDVASEEAHAYGIDTNWYSDTGATHHVTSDVNNLSVRDTYNGRDKVNTAGGQGMDICHIGNSQPCSLL